MNSKRLLTIASLVDEKRILDVGCDHAYLPIYLAKNKICDYVYASDISKDALENAKKNVLKSKINNIKLILSDGLKNINEEYDMLIISGMGSFRIIEILKSGNLPNKMIISSQSDLYALRKYINSIGYKIKSETVILENNIYYSIIYYEKGIEKLSLNELFYGKSDNKDYYKYLYNVKKDIYKKVDILRKIKMLPHLFYLKKMGRF